MTCHSLNDKIDSPRQPHDNNKKPSKPSYSKTHDNGKTPAEKPTRTASSKKTEKSQSNTTNHTPCETKKKQTTKRSQNDRNARQQKDSTKQKQRQERTGDHPQDEGSQEINEQSSTEAMQPSDYWDDETTRSNQKQLTTKHNDELAVNDELAKSQQPLHSTQDSAYSQHGRCHSKQYFNTEPRPATANPAAPQPQNEKQDNVHERVDMTKYDVCHILVTDYGTLGCTVSKDHPPEDLMLHPTQEYCKIKATEPKGYNYGFR